MVVVDVVSSHHGSGRVLIAAREELDIKKTRVDKVAKTRGKMPSLDMLPVEATFSLRALVVSGVDLPKGHDNYFISICVGSNCISTKKVPY